ncbi:angiotensin-converting enzyme [Caerostris extrusa]|uniref:Angiotensin-converting enzyme n=1 Tax=Caerostris extrusa TaxID=172846 RepID=A0AAV4Y5J5_CAEEX|nr:angiotensin-converting enzyme [Caerostris extrusa]
MVGVDMLLFVEEASWKTGYLRSPPNDRWTPRKSTWKILLVTTRSRTTSLNVPIFLANFFLFTFSLKLETSEDDMTAAIQFMTEVDREINKLNRNTMHAEWRQNTNFTPYNNKNWYEAEVQRDNYTNISFREIRNFPWRSYKDKNYTLYRWFQLASIELPGNEIDSDEEFNSTSSKEESLSTFSEMEKVFNKIEINSYKGNKSVLDETELLAIMVESRDPEELKYYWDEYRKATGRKYRHIFSKAIEEENEWAKNKGYENKGNII